MTSTRTVLIEHLAVPLAALTREPAQSIDHHLQPWIARHCRIPEADIQGYAIEHRSLDARKKPALSFIYRLNVQVHEDSPVHEASGTTVVAPPPPTASGLADLTLGTSLPLHPVVVGTGPAGLMAAYLLAMHGCKPLVLDRGRDVDRRTADVARFLATRQLDPDSNYLVGEGGAGTYSDGKLHTQVKDRRLRFLMEAFVAARAPRHILYRHHPHLGSDLLPHLVKRLRGQIAAWGGTFRWEATVVDVIDEGGHCAGVELASGERIAAPLTLIAPGHGARDLIRRLAGRGVAHQAKGFQLGCRVEHEQALIDLAQYGCVAGRDLPRHLLGAAEYALVSRPPERLGVAGATTFCMCPGGEIIAATADQGQLSTNGMSRFARAGRFANAGIIVSQEALGAGPGLAAFDLIESLERAAFAAGGGDWGCPAQTCAAFVRGEAGAPVSASSYRLGVRQGRIDQLLPTGAVAAIRQALVHFERLIPGFLERGNLIGVETRVSSPVKFLRDPATSASSLPGLYLAGEGAGQAGGIVSAGLDGLRLAETILTGKTVGR
jgi:uncharacterized FAD-dependent dehydrogenase